MADSLATNTPKKASMLVPPWIVSLEELSSADRGLGINSNKAYKRLSDTVRGNKPLSKKLQNKYTTLVIAIIQGREQLLGIKKLRGKQAGQVNRRARVVAARNVYKNVDEIITEHFAKTETAKIPKSQRRKALITALSSNTFDLKAGTFLHQSGIWRETAEEPNWDMTRCLPDFAKDPVNFMERYNKQQSQQQPLTQQQTLVQPQAQTGQQKPQYVFNNGALAAGAIFVADGATFTKVEVASGATYNAKSYGSSHKKRDKRAPHHRRRRGNKYSRKSPLRSPMTFFRTWQRE